MNTLRARRYYQITIICVSLVMAMTLAVTCAAALALPTGLIIADDTGFQVQSSGMYFIHATDLKPGDIITKTVTISNYERGGSPFRLSMISEPGQITGPADLLEAITLTMRMGNKTLYQGRLKGTDGIDMTQNLLDLGTYKEGDTRHLELILEVGAFSSTTASGTAEGSTAEVAWQFYAVKSPPPEGGGTTVPKTGDLIQIALYIVATLIIGAIALMWALAAKRRKEEEGGLKS